MRKLLSVILLSTIAGSAIAGQIPSFAGNFNSKDCQIMDLSQKVNSPDLAIEIQKSGRFVITQTKDSIILDGNTNYWNMAPKIYLTSTSDGNEAIEIKYIDSNSSSLEAEYISRSGSGANKNTDSYRVSLEKNNDGSVHMEMTTKYKNLLTLGFWKRSAHVSCDFIP